MSLKCKCKSCGHDFDVECSDWELVSTEEAEMGEKSSYAMNIDGACPSKKCGKPFRIDLFEHTYTELETPARDSDTDNVKIIDGWCERKLWEPDDPRVK